MTEKIFVFVLMPFDKSFNDIYNLGIKAACKELDVYCERVDEQIFTESILDRIYNQILKADILIADMTGRNPNVFYETGFAHAFEKRTILLTQNSTDIPFDLKHYPHIVYEGSISNLKNELLKRIKWFIDNPDEKTIPDVEDFEYYFDGEKIENGKVFNLNLDTSRFDYTEESSYSLIFQLDILNPNDFVVEFKQKVVLETSDFFPDDGGVSTKTIKTPESRYIHIASYIGYEIYPKMYESITFKLSGDWNLESFKEKIVLRLHNEISVKEITFEINFSGK